MGEMMKKFICLAAALLLCSQSWAGLGADLESVHSDRLAWDASLSQSAVSGATLHSLLLPNGITVREYVDAAGRVFAVAWEGPVQPDFVRLLGRYFASYQEALRKPGRSVGVNNATLVLESGGRMAAFHGRAWLPTSLPATLTGQDIR